MDYSYTYTTTPDADAFAAGLWGFVGAFAGMFIILILVALAMVILTCVAKYRVLKRSGHPRPWAAIIPWYSDYEVSGVAQLPKWYAIAMPIVGVANFFISGADSDIAMVLSVAYLIMGSVLGIFVAKAAGYGIGFRIGIAIPGVAVIFWMICAFGSNKLGTAPASVAQAVSDTPVDSSAVTIDDEFGEDAGEKPKAPKNFA